MHGDGTQWLLSLERVIEAIERGERYFIECGSESMLVSVMRDGDGRKTLSVGVEPSASRLLQLPRDRGA